MITMWFLEVPEFTSLQALFVCLFVCLFGWLFGWLVFGCFSHSLVRDWAPAYFSMIMQAWGGMGD